MSIPIPSDRVPPIAKAIASSKQTSAILFGFGAVLAAISILGAPHRNPDPVTTVIAAAVCVIPLVVLGLRKLKAMRRAHKAVECAAIEHVRFSLEGRLLRAETERGVALPQAWLMLSKRQARTLTEAVTQAAIQPPASTRSPA